MRNSTIIDRNKKSLDMKLFAPLKRTPKRKRIPVIFRNSPRKKSDTPIVPYLVLGPAKLNLGK